MFSFIVFLLAGMNYLSMSYSGNNKESVIALGIMFVKLFKVICLYN